MMKVAASSLLSLGFSLVRIPPPWILEDPFCGQLFSSSKGPDRESFGSRVSPVHGVAIYSESFFVSMVVRGSLWFRCKCREPVARRWWTLASLCRPVKRRFTYLQSIEPLLTIWMSFWQCCSGRNGYFDALRDCAKQILQFWTLLKPTLTPYWQLFGCSWLIKHHLCHSHPQIQLIFGWMVVRNSCWLMIVCC